MRKHKPPVCKTQNKSRYLDPATDRHSALSDSEADVVRPVRGGGFLPDAGVARFLLEPLRKRLPEETIGPRPTNRQMEIPVLPCEELQKNNWL